MKESKFIFKKSYLAAAIMSCCAAAPALASDINFSGFISVGGSIVDDKNGLAGYGEDDLVLDDNLLGLQVSGKVAEKITATAQLIARSGDTSYQLNSEWAYLTWQVADNTKLRMGRLRTPFYMYSDSLDVGYSYTWITPPREVYSIPFNNVDGVDIYNTWTLGSFDTTLQAYFGTFEDETVIGGSAASIKTRNQMGIVGTIGKDWWTLRAAYHQADLTIDSAQMTALAGILDGAGGNGSEFLIDEDTGAFAEVGLNIDTGKFVAALEHTELTTKHSFSSKNVREYAMAGVRMGDFLVHVTASRADDEITEADSTSGVPVIPQTAVLLGTIAALEEGQVTKRNVTSIGTRWDVTAGTAFKLELSNVRLGGHDPLKTKDERSQKVLAVAVQTVF